MNEVDNAKKVAELSRKLDSAKRNLDTQTKMLETRIREGSDTAIKAIDVKYAADKVAKLQKEINSLS